jgi:3-methyladenine DNA glycosylase AlkC
MISVCKESACASVLWIRESVFNESEQVESTHVESVEEVVVSFEQEAKATKAAINNTFFILI